MSPTAFRLLAAIALLLAPSVALAHPGHGEDGSLLGGFIHPFGGIDHLLAMTAVGLFAAHLGGRALWAVPTTFVAVMALGGVSLGVPLNPYRFVYRDANGQTPGVFRVAPVFAALDLGVGAEWP